MRFKDMDYKKVLHYFEQISEIPRGSGNVGKIGDYLMDFAAKRNLKHQRDEAGNVLMFKNGSAGCEDLPPLILQGHIDMVCEKEEGVLHDFEREGIRLRLADGFLQAEGTTLGADNGVAVAYALALLDDGTIQHPPLEVVLTSDEEVGLLGATRLDVSPLRGKCLINLDSEEEGFLLASCAGGATAVCTYPLRREERQGTSARITIVGLQGGHSGMEIDKNRGNAALLLGRLLLELKGAGHRLIDAWGGAKDNVIPREAGCRLLIGSGVEAVRQKVQAFASTIQKECKKSEPNVKVDWEVEGEGAYAVVTAEGQDALLGHLLHAANGVQVMSSQVEGLVESSMNLGVVEMGGDFLRVTHSIRSSLASYKRYLRERLRHLVLQSGGKYEERGEYPEWEFRERSAFRDLVCRAYEERYGEPMKVEAVHAGLECGVLSKKMPDVDMVSLGPNVYDVHTPKERMEVASAIRTYQLLERILEALAMEGKKGEGDGGI